MAGLRQVRLFADKPLTWVLIFAAAVLATQIGSLHRESIDWDEGTFILMASDVLDGELPYIKRFDIKPPFMFYLLAGVMAVFGKSLVAIRLFGDFCILASSVAAFAIARRKVDTLSAGVGVLLAIFMSAPTFGQHTSTELPAMAMLMWALWLIIARPDRLWAVALAGLLISLATLTRTNLGVVAVAFGLYFLWISVFGANQSRARRSLLAYILAGLVPPLVLVMAYAHADALDVLKLSVVDVALAYSGDQMSALDAFKSYSWYWMFKPIVLCLAFGAVDTVLGLFRSDEDSRKLVREDVLLWLMFGAVSGSVLITGAAYHHYWLHVIPFAGVFASRGLGALRPSRPFFVVACSLAMIPFYFALMVNGSTTLRVLTEPGFVRESHGMRRTADRIDAVRRPDDTVWALGNHLVLWYLDAKPVSKVVTHPSNLVRAPIISTLSDAGYIAKDELRRIVRSRPTFVVSWPGPAPAYLGEHAKEIQNFINSEYVLFYRYRNVVVYRLWSPARPEAD